VNKVKVKEAANRGGLRFRVLMQPHSIRIKPYDQPVDAIDLQRVSRPQHLAVALNPLVYVYAGLTHA
jgi:hypothetical protein